MQIDILGRKLNDRIFKLSSMPWNTTTPQGFAGEVLVSAASCGSYFIILGAQLTLFISICLQHQAFYKMFAHSVLELDTSDQKPQHVYGLVRFHISIKT